MIYKSWEENGKWLLMGAGFLLGSWKCPRNVPKLMGVTVVQLCERTNNHWIVYYKWVNCMVRELYSREPVRALKKKKNWQKTTIRDTQTKKIPNTHRKNVIKFYIHSVFYQIFGWMAKKESRKRWVNTEVPKSVKLNKEEILGKILKITERGSWGHWA